MDGLDDWDSDGLLAKLAAIQTERAAEPALPAQTAEKVKIPEPVDFSSEKSKDLLELDPELEARMDRLRAAAAETPALSHDEIATKIARSRCALSNLARKFAAQRVALQDAVEEAAAAVGARERGVDDGTLQRRAKAHLVRLTGASAELVEMEKEFTVTRRVVETLIALK